MINNVTLVGRLTKDPDLRYTSSGKAVASFTLAVNRRFTNQAGQREADYIQCVIWGKSAETLANYAKKGSLIGIVGRLQSRSYENKEQQRVYVTEVVVETFQLLEPRTVNEQRQSSQNNQQNDNSDPNFEGAAIDISDDDLPF
ncbi:MULTISPECIES: single-stranded DNA-binding protein [unclassified Enterococcus]|uniref:single-stranded DNA-binding protein n=1 Tax=unclassified Enterococcus TaxID=2608891 RepID=UPI003F21361B